MLWAKDLIDEAVKASPEASMAWAGVCIILPLLTNPSTADEANRDGFTYVTTRMHYYVALEPLLLQLSQDWTSATVPKNVMAEFEKHIIDLYHTFSISSFEAFCDFIVAGSETLGEI